MFKLVCVRECACGRAGVGVPPLVLIFIGTGFVMFIRRIIMKMVLIPRYW